MSVADVWQLECSWRIKETQKTSPWHHTLCITFFLFLVIIVVSCSVCRPESKKAEPCFEKSILWWFYGSSLRQCRKLGWAFSKMKYNPSLPQQRFHTGRFRDTVAKSSTFSWDSRIWHWCQVVNLARWGRRDGRWCQVEVLDGRWRWGCCRWGESQVKNLAF